MAIFYPPPQPFFPRPNAALAPTTAVDPGAFIRRMPTVDQSWFAPTTIVVLSSSAPSSPTSQPIPVQFNTGFGYLLSLPAISTLPQRLNVPPAVFIQNVLALPPPSWAALNIVAPYYAALALQPPAARSLPTPPNAITVASVVLNPPMYTQQSLQVNLSQSGPYSATKAPPATVAAANPGSPPGTIGLLQMVTLQRLGQST